MEKLYIVMPAYNEEENIETVVKQWYSILDGKSEDSRLVVADAGSTDKTDEILRMLRNDGFEKLEILSSTNQFHGPKCIALYEYSIKQGADYIFQTDSDGQTNPDEFDVFWQQRHVYDGIFGNRVIRGDGKDRAFVERVVCILLKCFFSVNIPDANAPFRLMKADVLERYLRRLPHEYDLPNIMLTTYFVKYKERYKFNEISFKSRQAGTNSINIRKIVKIGCGALKDFWMFRREMIVGELQKI